MRRLVCVQYRNLERSSHAKVMTERPQSVNGKKAWLQDIGWRHTTSNVIAAVIFYQLKDAIRTTSKVCRPIKHSLFFVYDQSEEYGDGVVRHPRFVNQSKSSFRLFLINNERTGMTSYDTQGFPTNQILYLVCFRPISTGMPSCDTQGSWSNLLIPLFSSFLYLHIYRKTAPPFSPLPLPSLFPAMYFMVFLT